MKPRSARKNEPFRANFSAVKIETVTGESIRLGRYSGYSLNFVIQCGADWIAEVQIADGTKPANNRRARVFASKNPGVQMLMELAHARGELPIKTIGGTC